ncbi:MAG: MmgE/PrpD family protein [Pollutimonas bauzanensis]
MGQIKNLNEYTEVKNLTAEVASFVVDTAVSDLPQSVIDAGKKSILDGIGLGIAGSIAKSGQIVNSYLKGLNAAGGAAVIGTSLKVPARFAAFANGIAIHADDYDDTQLASGKDRVYGLLTHPTAPALPAALATAEVLGKSGAETMLAYHLGVEIECKIAEAIDPRHYQHGFHATATCGTFAAAAAAAKLRGLGNEEILRALAIAGSQSAGLRENFGTMTKPFHAGRSSESGIVAVDFATAGWTATDKILEASRGFFRAAGGGFDAGSIVGKLGAPWTFADPGVSIKPHPSGSLTHPGMTKLLELIIEHDIKPEEIVRVDAGTNQNMPNALIHHRPANELQAKFSMEFCLAMLLLDRRAGLREFTDEATQRDDVKQMIEKINFHVHPEAESAGYDKMTTILDIHLTNGRHIQGRADFGKGSPANPMSYDEVADKFRECCDYANWPKDKAEKIVALVQDIENIKNIRELTLLYTAAAR